MNNRSTIVEGSVALHELAVESRAGRNSSVALPTPALSLRERESPKLATLSDTRPQGPVSPWVTFILVAIGTFMIMLDASIVNISLPSIARNFHTPLGGAMEWVIIAYLVTIAATLLTFGRLSDMIGRKPIWLSGLAL